MINYLINQIIIEECLNVIGHRIIYNFTSNKLKVGAKYSKIIVKGPCNIDCIYADAIIQNISFDRILFNYSYRIIIYKYSIDYFKYERNSIYKFDDTNLTITINNPTGYLIGYIGLTENYKLIP